MKNSIIIALHNNGLQEVSALTLSSASAYVVYKFKRAISKAVEAINEAQRGIVNSVSSHHRRSDNDYTSHKLNHKNGKFNSLIR